jgi:hypothetical protein
VETVIAALAEDDEALTGEAADLIFHLIVLLQARGLGWPMSAPCWISVKALADWPKKPPAPNKEPKHAHRRKAAL